MEKAEILKIKSDLHRVFSSLILIAPFTYPLLIFPIVIRPKMPSCAATDGLSFFVNPEKWFKMSFKQQMFVAMHEFLHVVLMHSKRCKSRLHHEYNCAADFIINSIIASQMGNHFDIPESSLFEENIHKSYNSEQLYDKILNEIKSRNENGIPLICSRCNEEFDIHSMNNKSESTDGCPVCGGEKKSINKNMSLNECIEALRAGKKIRESEDIFSFPSDGDDSKIIDSIIQAAARARALGRGLFPSFYEEFIDNIKKSNIPWERLLIRFAKESLKGFSDRNPFKPEEKYLPFDIFIPKECTSKVGKLVLIVDTSGSMDTSEFEYACGHLKKLTSLCENCTLITADAKVQEIVKVKSIINDLKNKKIKFKGRGGTNMKEAFERASILKPNLIILFSDMDIGEFPPKPNIPIIFLATKNCYTKSSPYGIFIKMN
jgi:predicted metal-dependent peptidase